MSTRTRWAVAVSLSALASCGRPPLPGAADGSAARPAGDGPVDAPIFLPVAPCLDEAVYATAPRTVTFGFLGTPPGFSYDPNCLAIDAGDTVTFSGSFAAHPIYPSAKRGTITGNPISGTSTGDRKDVVFPGAGFFAYFCGIHGGLDDGSTMAGVVWVR